MKAESQESRVAIQTIRIVAIVFALALPVPGRALAQCYIDPVTGQRICTPSPATPAGPRAPALDSRLYALDSSAHCRISVADGSTGSGTLIDVDDETGLVLSCSHLFDSSTDNIVVSFPNGSRFAARLIERDRTHDLSALAIRRPSVEPLRVSRDQPESELTACGFGPAGQFRCIRGAVTGQATAVGAIEPSLTIAGAVRPGDSGGGVLNARGEVVGVVWGQRDDITYATCGQPLRNFLDRLRGQRFVPQAAPNTSPQSPAPNPAFDFQAWSRDFESRLRALDEKKQDKGDYLRADALNDHLRTASGELDLEQYARQSELDNRVDAITSRYESIYSRIESVREHVEQLAAGKAGVFQGLSIGKLVVGALGLSGPLAAAVVIAGGLAGRRWKKRREGSNENGAASVPAAQCPVAVDSPPPPQRTVPETHYVSVEKDSFAKAHQWASEHVARKYPGATEILQAQDSLIKQYLAAK